MKNIFKSILGWVAMFMSFFRSSPSNHRDRLYERMMKNNAEAYNKMRNKLQAYADRFKFHLQTRDKNGLLVHTKKSKRQADFIKARTERNLLRRNHKKFIIQGQEFIALNLKNAFKKYEKLNGSLSSGFALVG